MLTFFDENAKYPGVSFIFSLNSFEYGWDSCIYMGPVQWELPYVHVCAHQPRSRVFYYWGLGILRLDRLPKVTGPLIHDISRVIS